MSALSGPNGGDCAFQKATRSTDSETGPNVEHERPATYCEYCGWTIEHLFSCPTQTPAEQAALAIRDDVWAELLACYGEGDDTDWPYLTDLCDLIVGMIVKHSAVENGGQS